MKYTLEGILRAIGRTIDEGFEQIFTLVIIIAFMEPILVSFNIAIGILALAAWAMLSKKLVRNLQIKTYGFWID